MLQQLQEWIDSRALTIKSITGGRQKRIRYTSPASSPAAAKKSVSELDNDEGMIEVTNKITESTNSLENLTTEKKH